eukprot:GFUD01007490.1.p1 GENE.GFUD01007490.1~~GFUD01007490.1.p1  ORF type:complete len:683 (+),score=120.71 GFUD01007490.1:255-2303(+)
MILPELLLSTSLISLAIFLWTFLHQWKGDGCPEDNSVSGMDRGSLESVPSSPRSSRGTDPPSSISGSERCDESLPDNTPLSSTPGTPRGGGTLGGLSRRQRKNRKRDKDDQKVKNKKVSKSPVLSRKNSDEKCDLGPLARSKKRSLPCKQYDKLAVEDHDIYNYFSSYLLTFDQMRQLGFPQDSSLYPGKAYIYRDPEFCQIFPEGNSSELDDGEFCENKLDANAEPFFPTESEVSLHKKAKKGNIEDYWCGDLSDSEGSGDSSDKSIGAARTPERKKSFEEISGAPLNATAKEFVPSFGGTTTPSPSLVNSSNPNTPSPRLGASQTHSAPNLLNGRNTPPPLITAGSSITLWKDFENDTEDNNDAAIDGINASDNRLSNTEDERLASPGLQRKNLYSNNNNKYSTENIVERKCVRCKKTFLAQKEGEYLSLESCSYHWGKLRSKNKTEPVFTCCGGRASRSSKGCTSANLHVWTGLPTSGGILGPLEGYVKTKHRKSYPSKGNFGVYGLDCEMCYTPAGLELTKVTVVGIDGRLVYESLVTPDNEIIDFNTRFSGIAAKDLAVAGQTKNLKEVQNDLMGFINADTIMVGHGLENDLRALNIIHGVVLDTAVVFPHFYGLPFRRSLRSLVSSYLKRDIQASWGHDSYEDARACIELMLWKTRKDLSTRKFSQKLPSSRLEKI